ncbi:MAG: hypothetical protein SGCHY_002909 [Lobulomycetales sp.]
MVKCWACWQENSTPEDPLIRPCLGCRDPELQYIHSSCIDKFLSLQAKKALVLDDVEKANSVARCTRCMYQYSIVRSPLSISKCIRGEPLIFLGLLFLFLVTSVLTEYCLSLIVLCLELWEFLPNLIVSDGQDAVDSYYQSLRYTLVTASLAIMLSQLLQAFCWTKVYTYCRRLRSVHVVSALSEDGKKHRFSKGYR